MMMIEKIAGIQQALPRAAKAFKRVRKRIWETVSPKARHRARLKKTNKALRKARSDRYAKKMGPKKPFA